MEQCRNGSQENDFSLAKVLIDYFFRLCAVSRNVCVVNYNGILNWNDCDWTNGVRPFWFISEVYELLRQLQGVLTIIKRVHNLSRIIWDKYKRIWEIFKN